MLKCGLKNSQLDFTQGLETPESTLCEEKQDVVSRLSDLLEEDLNVEGVIDIFIDMEVGGRLIISTN
jgi:hypothetical protein